MADRLTIANAALLELGQRHLEFASPEDAARFGDAGVVDPEDVGQQRIAAIYPQVRNTLMNAHPWSFLQETHRPQSAPWPEDTENEFAEEYKYRYRITYPWVGSIRAVFRKNQPNTPETEGWRIEGGYLISRFEVTLIREQRQVAEQAWPQLFVTAVTLALAARLAMPILYDQEVERSFMRKAEIALNDAMRVDAQSQPPNVVPRFGWLEARFNGIYGGRADRYRS